MKTTFRAVITSTLLLAVGMICSQEVMAVDGSNIPNIRSNASTQSVAETVKSTAVCKRFSETKLGEKSTEASNKIKGYAQSKIDTVAAKRSEFDAKRVEVREGADSKRQEYYDKLAMRAITDEQKAAVEEFKQTVEAAVLARRQSQDEARTTYRAEVDALLAGNTDAMTSISNELESAITSALAKAKTSCENGTPVDQVATTLKDDLKTANELFKTATPSRDDNKDDLRAIADKRALALKDAVNTFQTTMEEAKTKLSLAIDPTI